MQLLLADGLCGMTPRDGSIVGGLFFMMVGVMQLTFEAGNINLALAGPGNVTNGTWVPLSGLQCYYTLIAMETVCILMAMVMLAAVWTRNAWGLLCFGAWMTLFDLALVAIVSLLYLELKKVGLAIDSLAWCGLACRIITDPFWLIFIITYGLQLWEEKNQHKDVRKRRNTEGRPGGVKFKGFDSGI
ncbi:transmembrane protein 217-like [Engraulis encrasicolus]|uniref:transmembrane protein 217-like n=1 Tax=Engraulis encrasicolus TaxID=184585 RepID=UPI002FD52278